MIKRTIQLGLLLSLLLVLAACNDQSTDSKKTMSVVAVHNGVPGVFDDLVAGFQAGMVEQGYREGETVRYVYTTSGEDLKAAIDLGVDMILSIPGTMAFISGAPLGDIPVVFVPASDPITQGLVESLSLPGGNATGIMQYDAADKRFQLLMEAVPAADLIYVVYDGTDPVSMEQVESIEPLAREMGVELMRANSPITNPTITRQSIADIPPEADGIFMVQGHGAGLGVGWTDAAVRHGIPLSAIGMASLNANYGPFMAYGPDMHAMGIQAARLAAQVLEGSDPAALSVETAELYMMVDLRIADLIDLEVPGSMLRQAKRIYRADTDGELPSLELVSQPASQPASAAGFCQAYETNPAGTNLVCATVACDQLLDSFVTYTDHADVAECATEGLVGTCLTNDMAIHYYEGETGLLQMGCGFSGGEWVEPGA